MTFKRLIAATTLLTILSATSAASAGVLDGHPGAFFDGGKTWSGSTPFTNGAGVAGTIEWAVFGPGEFPFGGSGYTPAPGQLTYAYQVFSTGSDAVTSFALSLAGPANTIGSFSLAGGEPVAGAALVGTTKAEWTFAGLDAGEASEGLAFSATHEPQELFGFTLGGGRFAIAMGLPSPSTTGVPEPTTLSLLAVGGCLWLRRKRA